MSFINAIIKIPIQVAQNGMYVIQQNFIDVDFEMTDAILSEPVDRENIRQKFQEFVEENHNVLFDDSEYDSGSSLDEYEISTNMTSNPYDDEDDDDQTNISYMTMTNSIYDQEESVMPDENDENILSDYESLNEDDESVFSGSYTNSCFSQASPAFDKTLLDVLHIFIKPEELKTHTGKRVGKRTTLKNRVHPNKYTAKKYAVNLAMGAEKAP